MLYVLFNCFPLVDIFIKSPLSRIRQKCCFKNSRNRGLSATQFLFMLSLASLANETSTILLLMLREEKEMGVFILLLSNLNRTAKKYCEVLVCSRTCISVLVCVSTSRACLCTNNSSEIHFLSLCVSVLHFTYTTVV